jgi:hypothetical protein
MAYGLAGKKGLRKSHKPSISPNSSSENRNYFCYILDMNTGEHTPQTDTANIFATEISLQELEEGMVNAARLVRRYGAIYWPIVERLQREIDAIEKRDALLSKLLDDELSHAGRANFE